MKFAVILFAISFSIISTATEKSNIKYLGDVFNKITKEDGSLEKILLQIKTEAGHKDKITGTQLHKVLWVEKGSIYDRAGFKAGDFIANGNSPKTSK